MSRFAGKSALITGAGSGIGRATAELLLAQGAAVLLTGHDARQIEAAAADLRGDGRTVWGRAADVRDLDALERAAAELRERTHRIDHLVCAAGVQIPGTALTASEEDWQAVIDTNLSGAFRSCKAVLPAMVEQGGGSIVIVSSVQALLGKRNGLAYVAAKGGLNAMTRALALDHADRGVRVNAVLPGVVDTPMLREAAAHSGDAVESTVRQWARLQPLGISIEDPCQPQDVAVLIAFLLSSDARYITGSEFRVDGGLAAKLALG